MKKKLLSLILCAALMLGCTACQMTDSTEGASSQSSSAGEAKEEAPADEASGEEVADAGSEAAGDAVELDLYIDFTWFPTDEWIGIIPETLTQNGGVRFNVTRSADDSQLGLMIASGELPDVIFTSREIDRLCDSNLCYSYDELIEQYGVDWQPSSDRIGIAKTHNVDPADDHFYTVIQNYNTTEEWSKVTGCTPTISCLYYRKDIWEELGSPAMNTMEDILNVCKQVKEKYPDMIPISAGGPTWRLSAFNDWCSGGNEFLYADNGTDVVYRDFTDGFYDYLKYVNRLYREGLITEENLAITNEDDALQQAYSGKNFIYEWCARPQYITQLDTETQKIVPEAQWASIPIPDDAKPLVRANTGWAGVFISKNCKDPEAAIKMIAYMNSEEGRHLALWGREGEEYELDENGIPQFSEDWKNTIGNNEVFYTKYNNGYLMCTTELDEAYTYYSGVDQQIVDDFTHNLNIKGYPELSLALPTSTSDMGVIRAKINEARSAELVKLYTAESDEAFEAAYQSYLDLLKQIGVEDLNAYMTEQAAKVKADFGF